MLRILMVIGIVGGVLVAGVLGYAATRPDTFRVERSARIQAPPEKIVAFIQDFHQWPAWSPWEKIDPALRRTYGGAPAGKGAVYAWEGDRNVGKGRMEILEASPARVTIKLDFEKPFEAHNVAEFTLDGRAGGTDVTWAMHGPSPYMAKVIHTFVSMDTMIGKSFEAGLADLKTLAEK
jgi:hypothetical protein